MANSERAVFLKQSGESLAKGNGGVWAEEGLKAVTQEISEAYRATKELGISGITIIPGAGNIVRGRNFPQKLTAPDSAGRFGTALNVRFLQEYLENAGVPTYAMLANGMGMFDRHKDLNPSSYSPVSLRQAHKWGKVVLIGGGTGEDGKTTDNAVVFYAQMHKEHFGGEVVVLKSTKFDGVYSADPAAAKANGEPEPPRYAKISAQDMLADYERFSVVDQDSLERLIESGLTMLIYEEGKHRLVDILKHSQDAGSSLGTLVVAETCEPVFHS